MSRRKARGYRCLSPHLTLLKVVRRDCIAPERNNMSMVPECPICGGPVVINIYNEIGELVDCEECGTMLEVTSIDPPEVDEAPEEDEDWGE